MDLTDWYRNYDDRTQTTPIASTKAIKNAVLTVPLFIILTFIIQILLYLNSTLIQ